MQGCRQAARTTRRSISIDKKSGLPRSGQPEPAKNKLWEFLVSEEQLLPRAFAYTALGTGTAHALRDGPERHDDLASTPEFNGAVCGIFAAALLSRQAPLYVLIAATLSVGHVAYDQANQMYKAAQSTREDD